MEYQSFGDASSATFQFVDEDHTLANSLVYTLNQDTRVTMCGYSIPHPSEAKINIRVQTEGTPANIVLKDACQNLMSICRIVSGTFNKSVAEFKLNERVRDMDLQQEK